MAVATTPSKDQRPLSARTEDFLRSPKRNLIDGKWIEAASGETFAVYDPATGEIIDRVPDSGIEDIDCAVKSARRAFEDGPWPRMSPSARSRLLGRIGDLLLEKPGRACRT